MLKSVGVEPPKFHDVGSLLVEHRGKYGENVSQHVERIASISKNWRWERELSFYGEIDFIPTEEYTLEDARQAREDAGFVVTLAKKMLE